jgi:hypothetical protein
MSRSVNTHRNAIATVYLYSPEYLEEEYDYSLANQLWLEFIDDIRDIRDVLTGVAGVDSGLLVNNKPFTGFDGYEWSDDPRYNEVTVILLGELTEISISEYAGIAAVCLAPIDPEDPSHRLACEHAAPYFNEILRRAFPYSFLRKVGTFSNGESVYERIQAA